MGNIMTALQRLFWNQEMEIAVLGLQGAGKSTFVDVINTGAYKEDMMPTVGFNMHKVVKGKVVIKVWDMGGQEKFRSMWERYCRGVEVIVFVVDAADAAKFPTAYKELTTLLSQPTLVRVPLLLLFNKSDLKTAVSPNEIVKALAADQIKNRDVAYYSISCKTVANIDKTLDWIIKHANANKKK